MYHRQEGHTFGLGHVIVVVQTSQRVAKSASNLDGKSRKNRTQVSHLHHYGRIRTVAQIQVLGDAHLLIAHPAQQPAKNRTARHRTVKGGETNMTAEMTRLHRRMTTMLFAKADGAVTAASESQAMPQLSKCRRKNTC